MALTFSNERGRMVPMNHIESLAQRLRDQGLQHTSYTDAWVAALLNDKFGQTKHTLHDANGGYCCLGVAVEACGFGEFIQDEGNYVYTDSNGIKERVTLTTRNAMDLFGCDGLRARFLLTSFAAVNDDEDYHFPDIATAIKLATE